MVERIVYLEVIYILTDLYIIYLLIHRYLLTFIYLQIYPIVTTLCRIKL